MKKFEGILICSDLDGTLRNSNGYISHENINAINYFIDNGGKFTLCTGRNPVYASSLTSEGLKFNSPLIALNGAMIYDTQKSKILFHNPMDFSKIKNVDIFINENKSLIKNVVFHSVKSVENYDEIENDILYKVVFISDTPEDSKTLRKHLNKFYPKGFYITNSWPTGLEILGSNSKKGECIKIIKNYIDTNISTIICIGDYENDISMLKAADISYAVDNAPDVVKKAAQRITVSNDNHAIKKIIEEIN